jgi:restriction system protein
VARRRSFLAELQRGYAQSQRDQRRRQAAAIREQERLQREFERAQRAEAQARSRMAKADRAAQKAMEQELMRLRIEAREAEAEALTAQLTNELEEIDNVLRATLEVDDYVDLERLRTLVEHPPFTSPHHEPLPIPAPIQARPEPVFRPPLEPKGLGALLGGRRRYETELREAGERFNAQHAAWQAEVAQIPMRQYQQMEAYRRDEVERQQRLQDDWTRYQAGIHEREARAAVENERLDGFIAALMSGHPAAVEEYLSIVFGNSVYPGDLVSVTDYAFDGATHELRIELRLPRPDELPREKSYRYVKAKDEIVATDQTQKEQRDRYALLVMNCALRTLHEVWESDRVGHVSTISLTAFVEHVDPATGRDVRTPLLAVAVSRERFTTIDLARAEPPETLRHLNAVMSKDPWRLVPIDTGRSVRSH